MNALTLPTAGDLFVYESAANQMAETRVRVRPDNGGEVILRPGQQFRAQSPAERWNVRSYSGVENIDGFFIIGRGGFADSNTKNTVTLDASFANMVTVTNSPANRVPVSVDVTQTMPVSMVGEVEVKNDAGNPLAVSITGVGQVQENLIAYTGCLNVANTAFTTTTVMQQVVAPAANVNGIIINRYIFKNESALVTMLAKSSAPGGNWDGDVLALNDVALATGYVRDDSKIKIPAGKGLYLYSSSAASHTLSLTYTVL